MDNATFGPSAILIEGYIEVFLCPIIQERVSWPGIKTCDWRGGIGGQNGDIGYPTDVQYHAVDRHHPKLHLMKSRCQWRALAARGDVHTPKVGDGRDPGQVSDRIGIADLEGEGISELGPVEQGLTMTADGCYPIRRDPRLGE